MKVYSVLSGKQGAFFLSLLYTKPNGGLKPLISKRTLLQCILRLEGFPLSMPAYIHILDCTKVILDIEFHGEAHKISLKSW